MGVTESKEDQKLQEIWAVVDEDSDEEDKLKKQKKVLTQGVKLAKPAGDTSSSSTTSASSVPTKPISHPESPFPGIRLRTEEDGDAATTKDEETKEQAVEPVAPGDEGAPSYQMAPCYSQSILMCVPPRPRTSGRADRRSGRGSKRARGRQGRAHKGS